MQLSLPSKNNFCFRCIKIVSLFVCCLDFRWSVFPKPPLQILFLDLFDKRHLHKMFHATAVACVTFNVTLSLIHFSNIIHTVYIGSSGI